MNAPQIHLMLNHVPVMGVVFVAVALIAGLVFRNSAVLRFALAMLIAVSLASIPVFLTGEPAEEHIEHMAGVTHDAIKAHERTAKPVTMGLVACGLFAFAALVLYRRRPISRAYASALLVAVMALIGALAWTAHLGGRIRHPEIHGAASMAERESESGR